MSVQLQEALANAILDYWEAQIGTDPILRIYDLTAGAPATTADAITATLIAEMTLPTDWMAAASGGSKAKSGTWEDPSANNTGTADFYRIYKSDGTTCVEQGTVTLTGGGGDLTLDNTNVTATQQITITGFTKTLPV